MTEEWRPFFGGKYEISDAGRVRNTETSRVLKPVVMTIGYTKVSPVLGGKNVQKYVHHLVAAAFIGPRPDGAEVNHIDGDKTNASASNLEYVSHGGNMRHARATGLSPAGSRCNRGHLVEADIVAMREARKSGETVTSIARRFGVSVPCASENINGRKWRHVS